MEKEEGKEEAGWAGLRFRWVLAHSQLGTRKILFFFKSFYNLQTNLNSIQIWISMTSTHTIKYKNTSQYKGKHASAWNAINKYLLKYINL
jgi:hypothetical protein